jgi:hypothetical protein
MPNTSGRATRGPSRWVIEPSGDLLKVSRPAALKGLRRLALTGEWEHLEEEGRVCAMATTASKNHAYAGSFRWNCRSSPNYSCNTMSRRSAATSASGASS